MEYKRPTGARPLHDFHKFAECTPFQDTLAIKISLDLVQGLCSYGGFKVTWSGNPQIFSAPLRRKYASDPSSFRGARTFCRSSITVPSLVGLRFPPPSGRPKTLSVLSVWLFDVYLSRFWTSGLCARFHHEGVGVQKRFWCRWI